MTIPSELKPLYASIKRLEMGKYLYSREFELYTIENDIDEVWQSCRTTVSAKNRVVILGHHDTEEEEEAFMYLLSELERIEDEEFMDEVLIETFVDFAKWSKIKLDFSSVYSNVAKLNFTDKTVNAFKKAAEAAMQGKPDKAEPNKPQTAKVKDTQINKVFISHASADKAIANELVELLELIGVPSGKIFFSSSPEYGIAPGEDFLARIKAEISGQTLVLFVMSKRFLNSHICLCEMGAAWVLSQLHIPVVIPPFSFGDIRGVIPLTQGVAINDPQQINALAKRVVDAFALPSPLQKDTWERKRDRILGIINEQIAREAMTEEMQKARDTTNGNGNMPLGGIQF